MRVFRRFSTALGIVAIMGLVLLSSSCEYASKIIAKDKLNQGAILYNQGRMKEAQQFFRDAISWDDKNAVGQLFLGATLVKDYKNLSGDERTKVANEALETYKKALSLVGEQCRNRDNAISYIATIYDDLDKKDEWREWILKRGEGTCATKDIQATTYYTVAVNYWTCSYDQTTRYQEKGAQDPFHYRNMDYPDALQDKKKAEDCAVKGLEYIEKALSVDPEYVEAMFYKGLLYRQQQMLTKEEAKRKELGDLAKKISDEAVALQQKKEAAAKKEEEAKPKA